MFKSLVWIDPEKIPALEPGVFRSQGGRLTTRPTRRSRKKERNKQASGTGISLSLCSCGTGISYLTCCMALASIESVSSVGLQKETSKQNKALLNITNQEERKKQTSKWNGYFFVSVLVWNGYLLPYVLHGPCIDRVCVLCGTSEGNKQTKQGIVEYY